MNRLHLSLLCLLLCDSGSLADMARRKDGHGMQDDALPTATTSAAHSSSLTHNPATIETPITTALPTHKVPLYIPELGPLDEANVAKVEYWGPANGGSTVYQVVMTPKATAAPVTATLIEDATNAELLGGQRAMTINGKERNVYAAASCGFADGLQGEDKGKDAGYCVYWYVEDHATSMWTSAVTQISAQTSIVPTTRAREPAPTQVNDDTERSPNSTKRIYPYAGLTAAATFIALTIHLLQPWAL